MSTIVAPPPMRWIGDRPVRRITVPEFEAMIGAGIFGKRDRLELIEGVLVGKMVKGERHSAGVGRSWRAVDRALPAGWHVRVEMPIAVTGRDSRPEPDVAVARGEVDDYLRLGRTPGGGDVALVMEVSDTSLDDDRAMAETYLAGGITAYWILDLHGRRLEVYRRGQDGPAIVGEDGHAELELDGVIVRIAVADMLPRTL